MKYLVCIEGERYKLITSKEKVNEYLKEYAEQEKARGVLNTSRWLTQMQKWGHSNIYNEFPDFVIELDEKSIDIIE